MKNSFADVPAPTALWDRVGIWLSGICVVHCLTLPLALLALPFFPGLVPAHEWIHPLFAAMLFLTTLPAAFGAWKRHNSGSLALLLLSGLGVVLLALWMGDLLGIYAEDGLTIVGSAILIVGHWKNGRACASTDCSHPH